MVLVDSLDMGHHLHPAHAGIDLSGRVGNGAMAWLSRMDSVWSVVGRGSISQSGNAFVSASLRPVDLVAKI